ncbi:hypothetical protein [Streptodolium elevatio]|uniref:Uncharacterized protein n=1 Tax=Streptodolium elevatio TaxID=3157996 RepID=A0ABV3DLG1_9ACTN
MTTPIQPVQVTAQAAYAAATTSLRLSLLSFVAWAFRARGAWNRPDMQWFAATVAPVVIGTQRQMAVLTDQYIAESLAEQTGRTVDPLGVDLADDLRGVPEDELYERPYVQLWSNLGQGVPFEDALAGADRRAEVLAETDLQMARVRAAQQAISGQPGAAGWRRVLRGERDCLLCLVAATQRYRKRELAAIHPGCDCEVEPIAGDRDPGQIIDPVLLEQVHTAVEAAGFRPDRGARNPDYRRLIAVREHGEIGPLLTLQRHGFTGPEHLARGDTPTA